MFGSASRASRRWRKSGSTRSDGRPRVASGPSAALRCQARPSARASRSARSPATKSTTLSRTASVSLIATACRTAASAQRTLRWRCAATVRAKAAASLVTLRASVESSGPCMEMGVAAPMFVPGDMAAMSQAITMNTPAEAACAPLGVTHPITGVWEASRRLIISRMLDSSPPGVSTSSTSTR